MSWATWAISGVVATIWGCVETDPSLIVVWAFVTVFFFTTLLILVLGERDSWGNRVRRTIPRDGFVRCFAFVLYTGSGGGVIWCTAMVAATLCTAGMLEAWVPSRSSYMAEGLVRVIWMLATVFGFVFCYCMTVTAPRTTLLKRVPGRAVAIFCRGRRVCRMCAAFAGGLFRGGRPARPFRVPGLYSAGSHEE